MDRCKKNQENLDGWWKEEGEKKGAFVGIADEDNGKLFEVLGNHWKSAGKRILMLVKEEGPNLTIPGGKQNVDLDWGCKER